MNDPGKYSRPFTWLLRSTNKDTTTGQDVETFTGNGTLWASVKEISASKLLAYGMLNSQATLELHFRQFPTVDAKDRLTDTRFSQLLIIDGVFKNFEANETVVYAHTRPGVE